MSGLSRLSSKRDQLHLDGSQRVLQLWATGDPTAAKPEAEVLWQAIAEADWDSVERYAGLNPALKRMTQLARESPLSNGRGIIDHFHLWGSRRCRRGVSALQTWGRTPGPDMISTTKTPLSQRVEPPRRCGRTLLRNAALEAGQHGFPAFLATNRSQAAPHVSSSRRPRRRAAREGCWWWERPPGYWRWCATRGSKAGQVSGHLAPLFSGVAPTISDPLREG